MKKNSWRYVSLSEDALASINHYDPTDAIIAKIDGENHFDDSFHESLNHQKPELYAVLDKSCFILTQRQKQIVSLRLIDDKTFNEIAEEIGGSRQNAYQTFKLAIESLRESVKAEARPRGEPGNTPPEPGNNPGQTEEE
jgi:RNA polymerase sigma factor (sigma-70 family)